MKIDYAIVFEHQNDQMPIIESSNCIFSIIVNGFFK
jgi:hypothetical protein